MRISKKHYNGLATWVSNFLEAEINSDIPNLNDRFQASVILKVPSKTPEAIPVTIDRKAQITPENAKLIRDIVKSIREEEKLKARYQW